MKARCCEWCQWGTLCEDKVYCGIDDFTDNNMKYNQAFNNRTEADEMCKDYEVHDNLKIKR